MSEVLEAKLTIDKLAKKLADASAALRNDKQEATSSLFEIVKHFLPGIRKKAQAVADRTEALLAAVKESPDAFPEGAKSDSVYGIKVGFKKMPDTVTSEDNDETTIAHINTLSPAQRRKFLRVKVELDKAALAKCTDDELAELKCKRVYGDNTAFVKDDDTDLGKLVAIFCPQAKEVM